MAPQALTPHHCAIYQTGHRAMFAIRYVFESGRVKVSAPFPASEAPARWASVDMCGVAKASLIRVDNPPA